MIEDNDSDAALVLRALSQGNFILESECVDNAKDFTAQLEKKDWDIIISDYSLPTFDGLGALEILKEKGLKIPFILISGSVGEEKAVEAMKAGAHDYILKDNFIRLIHAVKRELAEAEEKRRIQAELNHTEEQLRQSQKLEAIGRLAGGIAHDFNNILTVIATCAERAQESIDNKELAMKSIQQIIRAEERATSLTKQLLAFSRQQILQPTIVNVGDILIDFQKMLNRIIGEDVTLSIDIKPNIHNVQADPAQIEQVIMNLVVNARDALPQGGTIKIEASNAKIGPNEKFLYGQECIPGDYLKLIVRDSGCGMPDDVLMKIFDPFFTTKPVGKGTGLGLSTVFGIIRQCKGLVHVESKTNQGSAFFVYLPKSDSQVPLDRNRDPKISSIANTRATKNILYVEDEDVLREVVCDGLKAYGYNVVTASSGKSALEIIRTRGRDFDLLIIDVVMPEMDGPELAKSVRTIAPDLKILFLSGYLGDTLESRGIDWNSSGFLEKPFTAKILLKKLETLLQ